MEENVLSPKFAVTIREMTVDDIATVFHLGERLFTPKEVPNLYRSWDDYEVIGLFYDDAEHCFVAEFNNSIVGFVLGTTITKKRSAWKYGYLVWMGVDPIVQRMGVGERLFECFRDVMLEEGVRMMLVDTEADNDPAIRFFKGLGFGNEEEHIYMTLNLSARKKKKPRKKGNST
jgi:ribosomal protein S18 acetylase RimI-like enzyme